MSMRMDLQYFTGEKTEKATPKKRQDTRKKGQVPKSNDVNTAIILLVVFISLMAFASIPGQFMYDLFTEAYINTSGMTFTVENTMGFLTDVTVGWIAVAPIMLVAAFAGVVASMMQVGVLFAPEAIKPKLSKINPLKGKRIFSARALVELTKAILKIILVGMVAFGILWLYRDDLLFLALYDVNDGFLVVSQLTVMIGIASALLLLILSIPDLVYQRFDHEKQIRMSKHDVKDEFKKMEGDPLIKAKRKQRAQEMAMNRMMQEVPKADVSITNPTHYAVALRYDGETMQAPKVIAKGVDYNALRIRQVAKKHDISMVENRPLARSLYDGASLGEDVPEDLFKAVAEVLAYVYKLNKSVQ
ncbi:LOW QUALITY PROTEIN: flagellar biosynthesis protein FlhB [Geomicrobium sp. JCM 19037]|nr:LOW QUALITY PROTEIN: flagellar biosynthesis protein FlhB [Geomicrobium sp. JCM 19037]